MKRKNMIFLLVVLTILFVYMTNFDKIPEKIVLFQEEEYELGYLKGMALEGRKLSTAESLFQKLAKIKSEIAGTDTLTLSVFGGMIKKEIDLEVLPAMSVVVGGEAVGIRLYSKGVLVIGEMPVQGADGNYYEPYASSQIAKGDTITKINDIPIETIDELVEVVNRVSDGESVLIDYEKNGAMMQEEIVPVKSFDDGKQKLRPLGTRRSDGSGNTDVL